MGCIYKDINFSKSLMWFQLCYQKDPLYIENILDFIKVLFDTSNLNCVNYILKSKWDIVKNIDDKRFISTIGALLILEKKTIDAYRIYKSLVSKYESNNGDIDITDDIKYNIYLNIAYIYNFMSDTDKSIYYLNKIIQDQHKLKDTNLPVLFSAYHNYMINYDCMYVDNKHRFEIAKNINSLYNIEKKYVWNFKEKNKKIKIGYVSNAFFEHAASNFILPILYNHDINKFDIVLFTEQINKLHKYSKSITDKGIKIINILNKNVDECADIIYKEYIDILIDLDGYTVHNRLDIFAKNPAPIQLTYLGYPNSLALDFIHYRIVDNITDPPNSTQLYSEKRLYMPKCFLLYKPVIQITPVIPRILTKTDKIILGSLNKEAKTSKEVLYAWKEIMHKTQNTVIYIKLSGSDADYEKERMQFYKEKLNISEDRIIFEQYGVFENDYIKMFEKFDILLDTFPYSGTTTTCNTLYNSIPVVTYYNKDYHSHNVSSSILKNCGHEELITYSIDEYIQRVIDLCNNYEKINWYKNNIGTDFLKSMNPEFFMKDYEGILENLYITKQNE